MRIKDLSAEELAMIQTLRSQKAQKEGADSTHSNEGANNNNLEVKVKRTYTVPDVFIIGRMAKKKLEAYPKDYQNAKGKRLAIDQALLKDKKHRYGDSARFWDDVEAEGKLLDRARDLESFCKDQQLNYVAVKQHLVIEGKGTMKDIVLNGIEKYKGLILKFGDLLYDRKKECPIMRFTSEKGESKNDTEEGANE